MEIIKNKTQEEILQQLTEKEQLLKKVEEQCLQLQEGFSQQYLNQCFYLKGFISILNDCIITEDMINTLKNNSGNYSLTIDDIVNHIISCRVEEYINTSFCNSLSYAVNTEKTQEAYGKRDAMMFITNELFRISNVFKKYIGLRIKSKEMIQFDFVEK